MSYMYDLGHAYENFDQIKAKYKLLGCFDKVSSETNEAFVKAKFKEMF